ncbi:MAG: hypothetical protein LBL42_04075 [Tannerella sp.]|jgi:hypothetical protein|nr:hypothetical protein [Tannerella sp.]
MAKKKANIHAQQQKLQAVQRRKAFMQKLRSYCAMIGDASWFDLIPEYFRDTVYYNRGTSFTIRVEEGAKITKRFVKILYAHIDEEMKRETVELLPGSGKRVNLFDYYQVIYPLEAMLLTKRASFRGHETFRELYDSAEERCLEHFRQIVNIIYCACYVFCDLSKHCLYTFTYNRTDKPDHFSGRDSRDLDSRKRQIVTIGTLPLDVRHVKIDGERRPVCLVGEVRHHDNISTIEPSEVLLQRLRIPGAKPGQKAPVYVQQHAVDRIMQRVYCALPGLVASLIFKAFSSKRKIIPSGKNHYLVECYYDDMKIGYFLAVYVDGILVIRTFLLITHSGTPEGRKLEELTGLQQRDRAYLALDDLRSLANSDIIDDPEVRKIFIKAGCGSILEVCKRVKWGYDDGWLWDRTIQNRELSKMILEYIRLGAGDEDYFVNDD